MKRSRIIFLDHTPFIGGAQLALARHLNHIDLNIFEPTVICSRSEWWERVILKERTDSIKLIQFSFGRLKTFLPRSVFNFLISNIVLFAIVWGLKPDLIVINTERCLYSAILSLLIFRMPVVVFIRDFEFSKTWLRVVGGRISSFICVSASIKDYYFASGEKKARLVYVGTDLKGRLNNLTGEIAEIKESFGLREEFLIGFVGRLVAWKGVLLLPEIAGILSRTKGLPRWRIIVLGEGCGQQGDVTNELKSRVQSQNLDERFTFAGFSERLEVWYKMLSVVLHTSIEPEPFATVVVEALSASLPVIATDLGGTPEVIVNGENGFLVGARADAFAEKIIALMRDKALYERLRNGAAVSSLRFEEDLICRRLTAVYSEALTKHE